LELKTTGRKGKEKDRIILIINHQEAKKKKTSSSFIHQNICLVCSGMTYNHCTTQNRP